MSTENIGSLGCEVRGAQFGDLRLSKRLVAMVEALGHKPSEGFPQVVGGSSDLEGWYRFLRNPRVSAPAVLEPHIQSTLERVRGEKESLVIHDTSVFCFSMRETTREGLFRITREKQGFCGHFAVAATLDEIPRPLGLLGLKTFTRRNKGEGRKAKGKHVPPTGEGRRWVELAREVQSRFLDADKGPVHVMDREADSFDILSTLSGAGIRFVIRGGARDRVLLDKGRLSECMKEAPIHCTRHVTLSARRGSQLRDMRKRFPSRNTRPAKLVITARPVTLPRTVACPGGPDTLLINAVYVSEVEHTTSDHPVEWLLFTSEPIETSEDILKIVDIYRKRWLIEEFFKALKTGCAYEKRQLESRKTLEVGLAVLLPVAWRLLLLKTLGEKAPDSPGTEILTPIQIDLLRTRCKTPLPKRCTARQVLLALAELGGHIKNNGRPGWMVLGRAMDNLMWMEIGWRAAMVAQSTGYDQ